MREPHARFRLRPARCLTLKMNRPFSKDQKKIKGILFDFDGTLTFPGAIDFSAIKRAIQCPLQLPILEYFDTLSQDQREPLKKILDDMEEAAARKSFPNRGAERCLFTLKKMGLPLGILTRNSLKSVLLALERFNGIDRADFSVIITRDDSPPKPRPDGVYEASEMMGIAVSEILLVGDFRFDILCGKAAGAITVLLTEGDQAVMHPGDPEPDYTVKSLEEVLRIVGGG